VTNTDKHIREIFSNKLGNIETDVPDGLWENISQNLPSGSLSTVVSGIAKTAVTKIWISAGIAAAVITGIITWQSLESEVSAPQTEQITAPSQAAEEQSEKINTENTPEDSSPTSVVIEENGSVSASISTPQPIILGYEKNESYEEEKVPNHLLSNSDQLTENNVSQGTENSVNQNNLSRTIEKPFRETENHPMSPNISVSTVSEDRLEYEFSVETADAKNYFWQFEDGTTQAGKTCVKQFSEEGKYRVELTITMRDGSQKLLLSEVEAFRKAEFFIPNIFTPNNDGQNDVFDPQEKSNNLKIIKVVILDNNGKVFESQGEKLWDGTDLLGNQCWAGNYYYMVRATDRNHQIMEKTGSIRLIR